MQSLWYAQAVERFGYIKGPESITIEAARQGVGGEYFTDGYRAVIWLSDEPVSMLEVRHRVMDEPPTTR